MMFTKNLAITFYVTVLALATLYAPQPLLALLSKEFNVTPDQAALLITVTMLPLGLAPVIYGFILESVPARVLLKTTVFLLALSETPFLWVENFWILVAVRLIQGLLLPAILTALMTYLSMVSRTEWIKKIMAWYIAATILGGFLGRILAGLMASYFHWRYTFLLIMLGLFIAYGLLYWLDSDTRLNLVRPSWKIISDTLSNTLFLKVYLIIFLVFFCFASLLNLLPFHLTHLTQNLSTFKISLVYSGYLVGIVTALNATYIVNKCVYETNAIFLGLGIFLAAILLFNFTNFTIIFLTLFLFCMGMFLVHSVLSGYLNHKAGKNKGVVNGLYVSFYYIGGTLGSYGPGFIYHAWGWTIYTAFLATLIGIALGITWYLSLFESIERQNCENDSTPYRM